MCVDRGFVFETLLERHRKALGKASVMATILWHAPFRLIGGRDTAVICPFPNGEADLCEFVEHCRQPAHERSKPELSLVA